MTRMTAEEIDAVCARLIEAGVVDAEIRVYQQTWVDDPDEVEAFKSMSAKFSAILGRRVSYGRHIAIDAFSRTWRAMLERSNALVSGKVGA